MYCLDEEPLKIILEFFAEYRKEYLNAILMENDKGKTPLDISIENDNSRTTDLMLKYLTFCPSGNLSQQFYDKFGEIMKLNLKSFHEFLESCYFQTVQMERTKYLALQKDSDVILTSHPNCILDKEFFEKHTKEGAADRELREQQFKIKEEERKLKELKKKEDRTKDKNKDGKEETKTKVEPVSFKASPPDNEEEKGENATGGNFEKFQSTEQDDLHSSDDMATPASSGSNIYNSEESNSDEYDGGEVVKAAAATFKQYTTADKAELLKEQEKKLEAMKKKHKEDQKRQADARKQGLATYDIKAIEFDWIFNRKEGRGLMKSLASTDDEDIFTVPIIKNVILYLWKFYRRAIVFYVLLPFIVYFASFLLYATWINERKDNEGDNDDGAYHAGNYILIAVILICIIFNAYYETRQIIYYHYQYFVNFWNLVDMCSLILNTFCIIADLAGMKERDRVPVLSIAVLLMWLKFSYFGRMSFSTAWLVRMIYSITSGMVYFALVFFLMVLGFANSFLLIARMRDPIFTGTDGFWGAFKYSYRTGLGDFDTDGFAESGYDNVLAYVVWILSTFLILIVLLNALIAIISDIFDKVYENMENNLLKELVILMVESELLIPRDRLFKNKKYIVMISRQTGDTGRIDADSKLAVIKHHMDKQMKNTNDLVNQIETNIDEFIDNKLDQKSQEIEISTTKRLHFVNDQMERLDLVAKEYQDCWMKVDSRYNKFFG